MAPLKPRHRRDVPVVLFAAVALVGALAGCVPIPAPNPPQPPQPTPTPPTVGCQIQAPWCHELSPPASCSSSAIPCLHNPTQDPNHCELAPACPTDLPPPQPPPSTDCAPVLDPGLSAPVAEDGSWPKASDQATDGSFKQAVWSAVQGAKQSCPTAWVGDCMAQGASAIDRGYLLIAKQLQKAGIAASQARTPSGKIHDHLYVRRSPGSSDWNATKLFFYGNGCLITGDGAFTAHGWYAYAGGDAQPPEPPPSPGSCGAPLPPKVWTAATLPAGWGSNEIGRPRWSIACKPHFNDIDCTDKIGPHACSYCESIGMGTMPDGVQPRCDCPVRKEDAPDRQACEAYLTGGTRLQTCAEAKAIDPSTSCTPTGAVCEFAHGNPYQFKPSGGTCRLCSVEDPRVCGSWY